MAGPQDFMAPVPSLRVDTAPLLAIAGMLANAPQQFAQGDAMGAQMRMRHAFPEGLPTDAAGNIDMQAVLKKGVQIQGPDFIKDLAPLMQYQLRSQLLNRPPVPSVESDVAADQGQPTPSTQAGANNPAGASPRNIVPEQSAADGEAPVGSKLNPYPVRSQTDFNQVPAGAYYKVGNSPPVPKAGAAPALPPDKPVAQTSAGSEETAAGAQPSGGGASQSLDQQRPSKTLIAQKTQEALAADAKAAGLPAPTVAGAPGPVATPGGPAPQAAQAPRAPTPMPRQPTPTADALVPKQYRTASGGDPLRFATILERHAERLEQKAEAEGLAGLDTKGTLAAATDVRAKANQLREALRADVAPTTSQKEATEQGYPTAEALQLHNTRVKEAETRMQAINAAETGWTRNQGPINTLATAIMNSPDVYTGSGAERLLDLNKVKAAFADTPAATLGAAIQKLTSHDILQTMQGVKNQSKEAGEQSTRFFQAEMQQIQNGAVQITNPTAANRFLLELERRNGEQDAVIAKMARAWRKAHNNELGDEFDRHVTQWLSDHPVFSNEELAHPEKLGALTLPKAYEHDHQKALEWAQRHGVGADQPLRMPTEAGQPVKYVYLKAKHAP